MIHKRALLSLEPDGWARTEYWITFICQHEYDCAKQLLWKNRQNSLKLFDEMNYDGSVFQFGIQEKQGFVIFIRQIKEFLYFRGFEVFRSAVAAINIIISFSIIITASEQYIHVVVFERNI